MKPQTTRIGDNRTSGNRTEVRITDMNQTEAIKALQLFNEKADKLEGLGFTKDLEGG
jgi:hypothetical protein